MRNKIVYAASGAAVVLGAGTAALAASGGGLSPAAPGPAALLAAAPATPAAPAQGASQAPDRAGHGPRKGRPAFRALDRALHAQWVTRKAGSAGSFVTHDAIRGQVTAVSATSITVKAADGVSQTYAVTGSTKVHLRPAATGKGHGGKPGAIGDVHTGDQVAVAGTGTDSLTAEHIVDRAE